MITKEQLTATILIVGAVVVIHFMPETFPIEKAEADHSKTGCKWMKHRSTDETLYGYSTSVKIRRSANCDRCRGRCPTDHTWVWQDRVKWTRTHYEHRPDDDTPYTKCHFHDSEKEPAEGGRWLIFPCKPIIAYTGKREGGHYAYSGDREDSVYKRT